MKKKNKEYINVPNLFTAVNLFCGFLSILLTMNGNFVSAAWLIIMASLFDALDGRIARLTGVSSEFGLQMDSLSDVVSAGVAPSVLVYHYHLRGLGNHIILGIMVSFLPLLFACFRLARYNVISSAEGHSSDYMGVPAPTAASTLGAIILLHTHTGWPWLLRFLVIMTPLISLLMASQLKYEGIPSFNIREKGKNRFKLIVVMLTLIGLGFAHQITMFTFAMIYLLSGPTSYVYKLVSNQRIQQAKDEAQPR